MLFDLETYPDEITDLGKHPDLETGRQRRQNRVLDWSFGSKMRITQTNAFIEAKQPEFKKGIIIGFWDEQELNEALASE